MKTKLKSIITAAFALATSFIVGSALAVDAPTPVAVWNGDFNILSKGAFKLETNGNTIVPDGSSITIDQSLGVAISATGTSPFGAACSTMILEFSDYANPSSGDQLLLASTDGNPVYHGIAAQPNGNAQAYWNDNLWNNGKITDGSFVLSESTTHTLAVAWRRSNGTGSDSAQGTKIYLDGTLKANWGSLFGNYSPDNVAIGGPISGKTIASGVTAAIGMKIKKIAIFNSKLSADEIAAYQFPSPFGAVRSFSVQQNGICANGSIVSTTTYKTLAGDVLGSDWAKVENPSSGNASTTKDGITFKVYSPQGSNWSYLNDTAKGAVAGQEDDPTANEYSYMYVFASNRDRSKNANGYFEASGISFAQYDVYLYFQGGISGGVAGSANGKFSGIKIESGYAATGFDKAKYYSVAADGRLNLSASSSTEDDAALMWGVRGSATPAFGKNVVKIEGCSDSTFKAVYSAWDSGVAAVQIIERTEAIQPIQPGTLIRWANTGSANEVKAGSATSRFSFKIPGTAELPEGSVVRIKKVRLATLHTDWNVWRSDRTSEATFVNLNNIQSGVANGKASPGGLLAEGQPYAKIASNADTSDFAANYEFSSDVDLVVGTNYPAPSNNSKTTGLCLLHSNGSLNFGSGDDYASVRFVNSGVGNSIITTSKETTGYNPVYEIIAEVVSNPACETKAEIDLDDICTSDINELQALADVGPADKVVLTILGSGAKTFAIDTDFKGGLLKVIYDGDLVLTGAEEGVAPVADYLTKLDFSGVTGAITYDWLATGSGIAINFHKDYGSTPNDNDSNIPDLALKGRCWNNTEGATGEIDATIFAPDGESSAVGTVKATWEANVTYQGTGGNDFLGGYLDDGGNCVHINVDVPFALYDVIILTATDMGNIKFQPFTVNGTKYTWNDDVGMTVAGSEIWGISREATPVYGKNAIRVPQQTASKLTIVGESRNGSIARGCVAAVVIVKVNPPMDHTIECGDGKAMSAINAEVAGQGYEQVTLKFNNAATLTIDEAPARAYIVSDEGSLNLNYTLSEVTSLAYLDLTGVAGAMSLTTGVGLGFDYGAKAFTYIYNGLEEITPALTGTGAFTKAGSGTIILQNSFNPASITIAEGVLKRPTGTGWSFNKPITVLAGAQFYENGGYDKGGITYTIAGAGPNGESAAIVESDSACSSGSANCGGITLSADATFKTDDDFYMIGGGYAANTLALGDYTLTKIGASSFYFCRTTITGAGTIKVAEGALDFCNNWTCSMPDGTILLDGGNLNLSQAFTLKNLTIKNGAVTGNGALTLTGALKIDGTTVDFSSRALPLPGTLTADSTGTLKIAKPTTPTKIIAGTEIPAGFKIADADGNEITDVCFYNGYIWYGTLGTGTYTLTDDDLVAIGQLQSGGLYSPTSLEVNISAIGGTPDGYTAWIENGAMYVAKHTPERSISIKMNPRSDTEGKIATTDTNVGAYKVTGKFWNHSKNYNNNNNGTTEIFTLIDGAGEQAKDADGNPTLCYYYMPNSYFAKNDAQTTGNGKLTRTYFDDTRRLYDDDVTWPYSVGTYNETEYFLPETPKLHDYDKGELCWEVAITNIPYQVFDLYIYQASDQTGASITLMPIAVKANNKPWMFFKGDTAGSQSCAINSTWSGAPYVDSETLQEGVNYIRYRMSKAALGLANDEKLECVYLSHPSRRDVGGRLGLAGVQIVEVENDGFYTRTATEGGWLVADSWKNSNNAPISWVNPTGSDIAYATIDADAISSIDLDGEIEATAVTLVNAAPGEGEEEKTFTFTNTSGEGSLTTPTIDASGFHGKIVTCAGMSASINLGDNAYLEVDIPAGTEKSMDELTPGISIAGGSVKLTGAGTLVCDGKVPEAYKTSLQRSAWQGTVWIKNILIPDVKNLAEFNQYKSSKSTIRLTGVRGWMYNGDQDVELELKDDGDTLGLEIQDSSQNYKFRFPKFTGDGSFKAATIATTTAAYIVTDVSEFNGALLSTAGTLKKEGNQHDGEATNPRPIFVGYANANEVTVGTDSLINVKSGTTVNAGCGWQAASVAFGDTLIVKGAVGDTIVSDVTTAPTLNTSVTLKDAQGETVEGEYALGYDSEAQSVKIVRVVTVTIPEIAGAMVAVEGYTIESGKIVVPYGASFTVVYTANEGKFFSDGKSTKLFEYTDVTAVPEIDVSGISTVDAEAKIGTVFYLTLSAAIEEATGDATVTLLANVVRSETVELADKVLTFDLNGNTITFNGCTGFYFNGVDGTVKNGKVVVNAGETTGLSAIYYEDAGGTVSDVTVSAGSAEFGVVTCADGTEFVDKTLVCENVMVSGSGALFYCESEKMTLTDCSATQTGTSAAGAVYSAALAGGWLGHLTVNGGTYSGEVNAVSTMSSPAAITLLGGNYSGAVTVTPISPGYESMGEHFIAKNPTVALAAPEGYVWFGADDGLVALGRPAKTETIGENVTVSVDETGKELAFETISADGDTGDTPLCENLDNYASIRNVVIGDSVKRIGKRFFKNFRKLETVTVGANVTNFGEKAFYKCMSLEKIVIDNPNFDLNSLNDSIVYLLMLDKDEEFVMVPKIEVKDHEEILRGKVKLSDSWENIGLLRDYSLKTLKEEGYYHFFQTQLQKVSAK